MHTILKIKTDKNTESRDYEILVRPTFSAAMNVLAAAQEIVKDFEKENKSETIEEISFVSEETGKELSKLKF